MKKLKQLLAAVLVLSIALNTPVCMETAAAKQPTDAQEDTKTCRQYHDSRTIGRLARERRKQFFTWLPGRIRKQLVRWLVTGF